MTEGQTIMPISPETPIGITLQAQEWNVVLGILSDAPFKMVAPIIQKLGEQAQQGAQAAAHGAAPRPNGADLAA
jgi:hypothetical protein